MAQIKRETVSRTSVAFDDSHGPFFSVCLGNPRDLPVDGLAPPSGHRIQGLDCLTVIKPGPSNGHYEQKDERCILPRLVGSSS